MSDIIDEAFYYIDCNNKVCDRIIKENIPQNNFKEEKIKYDSSSIRDLSLYFQLAYCG